jgi:hypothetical protein
MNGGTGRIGNPPTLSGPIVHKDIFTRGFLFIVCTRNKDCETLGVVLFLPDVATPTPGAAAGA